MEPFHYLQMPSYTIAEIDWDSFDFPPVRTQRYNDRNGQNEIEDRIRCFVDSPTQNKLSITLCNEMAYPKTYADLILETKRFNEDPKASWKALLEPHVDDLINIYTEAVKDHKRKRKNIRKLRKRLDQQ